MNSITIGKAIEELREQHGLRIKDLAEVLNITPTPLGKIIKSEREFSFLMALRLFKRFDISAKAFASMIRGKEYYWNTILQMM